MSHQHIKEHYDQQVPAETAGHYEVHRWFKTSLDEAAYMLTAAAVQRRLLNLKLEPEKILEVGPGPGTWTKLLLARWPKAHFDLVDISAAMLAEAKLSLPKTRFKFFEEDFADFKLLGQYDLFFSSRAFEYFDDKEAFVARVSQALKPGGVGFMITKYPHPWLNWLRGRKVPARHGKQVSSLPLSQLLTRSNLKVEGVYPVTVSVPFLHSAWVNKWVGKIFQHLPLHPLTALITESYAVKFSKLEVVELFGLSGTGKSTLAKKLVEEGFTLIKIKDKKELIWLNFIFFSYFPRASVNFLKLLWHSRRGPKKLLYLKLVNLFLQANAKWILARQVGKAVIDQGHSQAFLSLFECEANQSEFMSLANCLPKPSELLVLELPEEERRRRLSERGSLPRAEFGLRYAEHWQQVTYYNYELFKKLLPSLKFSQVTFIKS